jgi:hypothetical protein
VQPSPDLPPAGGGTEVVVVVLGADAQTLAGGGEQGTDAEAVSGGEPGTGGTFGDGVHVVGEDIPPGLYFISEPTDHSCYWARLSGLDGESEQILENHSSEGPTVVEIRPPDVAFESSGCGTWTEIDGTNPFSVPADADTFGDGVHVVGDDIQPGRYFVTEPDDFCYWARLGGLDGESEQILQNQIPEGPALVEIRPTDAAFETSGCGTWTEIE